MNFKLKHHRKIIKILNSFNPTILHESYAYFGGGTLLALLFGEYRQSNDIDFVCSLATSSYKSMRTFIFNHGISALFSDLSSD
ncbi:MAG: nucleotidyl transferase AbiEii/AbiGii toxin family protein [Microcystaceae cyanobacterium]